MSPLRVNDNAIFDGIAVEVDYSVCTECGGKVNEKKRFDRYLARLDSESGDFLFNLCSRCAKAGDREVEELFGGFVQGAE